MEIMGIVIACEIVIMLMLPVIAPQVTGLAMIFVNSLLLTIMAGPLIYWRANSTMKKLEASDEAFDQISSRRNWLVPSIVLLASIGLTVTAVFIAYQNYRNRPQVEFDRYAERLTVEVERRMALPVYGMKGARGVYAASKSVEREEFRAYVETRDLLKEFPGVLGFGFIQRVERADLQNFIATERTDNAPDFDVRTIGDAADLYVIKFIDPMERNRKAWGYDIGSEPNRRAAAEQAIRTGEPTITTRLKLLQDEKQRAGFHYLVPVYRTGTNPTTPDERKAALVGLIYAPIILEEVFADVLKGTDNMLDVEIFDGKDLTTNNLLLDADNELVAVADAGADGNFDGRLFHQIKTINVGGRTWTLAFSSKRKFELQAHSSVPLLIGICGALLSALVTYATWTTRMGLIRAETRALEMTQNLRKSESEARRLSLVAAHTNNAVIIANAQGEIEWVNEGFTRITGYTLTDVIGKRPGTFLQGPKTDSKTIAVMRDGIAAGKGFKVEIINYHKNGKPYWLDVEVQPLLDSDGVMTGFMAIESDITQRKEAEQQLENAIESSEIAAKEAINANLAKSQFLAMMSHEIRTPMNGVIGMTSMLLDSPLTPQQVEFTEIIRQSGDSLLTIINDILDFSKIEAGNMDMESEDFSLWDCIEGTLDLLAPGAAEKHIDLLYEISESCPAFVRGDATRLRQILVNLLSNGLKFTHQGDVTLTVKSQTTPDGMLELSFAVRDTGIGIAADGLEKLFKSFSQVDLSTTRKYGGTGLGLVISKRLAELMGGKMWVKSTPNVGSTFFFTVTFSHSHERPRTISALSTEALKGRRLLVVDDNAHSRQILASMAQKWSLVCHTCASAEEALGLLRDKLTFDVAIIDMQMPEIDGSMLAIAIRQEFPSLKMPLLLLSSLGKNEFVRDVSLFEGILTKPAKPAQIHAFLQRILGKGVAPTETPASPVTPPADVTIHHDRILLAEDNSVNQRVALHMLSRLGYRADVAANGLEVLEAVQRQTYEIILMDMQMPEMDGLEATRRVRELESQIGFRPWIIALTANAMEGDREMCLAAGMDDYMSKPLKSEALRDTLDRANFKPSGTNEDSPS